jgi:hypothetical protein
METEQCVEMVRAIVWRIGLEVPTVIDVQLDEKEVDVSTTEKKRVLITEN